MAFEGLPEELMTLILAKLPVKSLMRFKCVQKSWYSLIKSPQFIHLHRSSSSSPQFIIKRRDEEEPGHILSFYSYETLQDLGNTVNIPITHPHLGWVSLSSACDGLVCITNHNYEVWLQIIICNPAIREFRSLSIPPSFGNRRGYHVDSVAFGCDPNTGEYKVVMIGVPFDNSSFYDPAIPDEDCINYSPTEDYYDDREAKVYDFSTDSWRDTGVVIPAPFRYKNRAVTLNGAFHWCPTSYCWVDSILTFHISDEVTDYIPLPDLVDRNRPMDLFVSSKSQLALIVHAGRVDDLGGRFDISVMTEYGVKESWTRLCEIEPLTFWGEQQLLLRTYNVRQLVSCDLQHQNLRYFPIYGVLDVFSYSESLVSINGI